MGAGCLATRLFPGEMGLLFFLKLDAWEDTLPSGLQKSCSIQIKMRCGVISKSGAEQLGFPLVLCFV